MSPSKTQYVSSRSGTVRSTPKVIIPRTAAATTSAALSRRISNLESTGNGHEVAKYAAAIAAHLKDAPTPFKGTWEDKRQPTGDIPDLLQLAESAKPNFEASLGRIADRHGGASACRIKQEQTLRTRMRDKGRPADTVTDILGGRIITDDPAHIAPVLRELRELYPVVEDEDKFAHPTSFGYCARHVLVKLPSGLTAEVQVNLRESIEIQDVVSHPIYEELRAPKRRTVEERQALLAKVDEIRGRYAEVLRKATAALGLVVKSLVVRSVAAFQEAKHPRVPQGQRDAEGRTGGEFAPNRTGRYTRKVVTPRGNVVYVYPKRVAQARQSAKFRGMQKLAGKLPTIRTALSQDIRRRDLEERRVCAVAVALIDSLHFRVGTEGAETAGEPTYGVTTLLGDHVRNTDAKIIFQFRGKKGVQWSRELHKPDDPDLASAVEQILSGVGPDERVFRFRGARGLEPLTGYRVEKYLKRWNTTPKAFRTLHGSYLAHSALSQFVSQHRGQRQSRKQVKADIREVCSYVSAELGNTPAIAKRSYIMPEIIRSYIESEGTRVEPDLKMGKSLDVCQLWILANEHGQVRGFLHNATEHVERFADQLAKARVEKSDQEVEKSQLGLPYHLEGGVGSAHRGAKKRLGRRALIVRTGRQPKAAGDPDLSRKIKRIVGVVDTRQYEEIGDTWKPIAGSGTVNQCARCGKDHEVHATVELQDGTHAVVGTSCMKADNMEMALRFEKLDRAARRLRQLEAEKAKYDREVQQYQGALAEVRAMPKPPIEVVIAEDHPWSRYEYRMGEARCWGEKPDDPERRMCVTSNWETKELVKRGIPHGRRPYPLHEFDREIAKVKRRIEAVKAESEVEKSSLSRARKIVTEMYENLSSDATLEFAQDGEWYIVPRIEKAGAATAEPKQKEWWSGAATGDERWITVHPDPGSPENYRHVKVRLRPSGKWHIIAGGTGLEHEEIVPKHKLTPEERERYEERRKKMEGIRKEREKGLERLTEVREQHTSVKAEQMGIAPTLTEDTRRAVEHRAETRAEDAGLTGDDRDRFVARAVHEAETRHHAYVRRAWDRLYYQAHKIAQAEDPELAVGEIAKRHDEEEDRAADEAAGKVESSLREMIGKPASSGEPEAEEPKAEVAIAETERAQPIYRPPKVKPISSVEQAMKIISLEKQSRKMIAEGRKELAKLPEEELSGTGTLEQFQITAELADEQGAMAAAIRSVDDARRASLNSTLVRLADETFRSEEGAYERYGKKRYDIGRAQVTGALDALTGISTRFIGSSFIDRPLVEALGVEAAAMLATREILQKRGRLDLDDVIADMESYHAGEAMRIAQEAVAQHDELEGMRKTVDESSARALVEGGETGRLFSTAQALAFDGELNVDAVRHLGTAIGSLHASATVMAMLRAAKSGKGKLDELKVNITDEGDVALIDRMLHLRGHYKVTHDPETGTTSVLLNPKSLARYMKFAAKEREESDYAKALQNGTAKIDVSAAPEGWKDRYTSPIDRQERDFHWKPIQRRAQEFFLSQCTGDDGGALIDLEVGGGKTIMALGAMGFLRDQGKVQKMLYIAPQESLVGQVLGEVGGFTDWKSNQVRGGARASLDDIRGRYSDPSFVQVVSAPTVGADVRRLEQLGVNPSDFFRELGYDGMVADEAHKLVSGVGGGKNARALRRMRMRYNLAMTGTLVTNAISQPFDLVRWVAGAKVDSRAKILRKYGEVGLGTTAWQDAVNADVRQQVDRHTFHGAGTIKAKLYRNELKVGLSETQRQDLAQAVKADKVRRDEYAKSRPATPEKAEQARRKLDFDRDREVFEILHNRDWKQNDRLREIAKTIKRTVADNPSQKFILVADTDYGLSAIRSVTRMLADLGYGDRTALFASQDASGQAISQKKMMREQARFAVDSSCQFAVLAAPQAIGRNMEAAGVLVHVTLPPDAGSEKQRTGRAWREGRQGDVNETLFYTDQHPFDMSRLLQLRRTAGPLAAISGGQP